MGINLRATATNNADWIMRLQIADAETGSPIDFSGAAIEIEVKDARGCRMLHGSVSDGKVTLPEVGVIEWNFLVTDMQNLCPGSYKMGGVYELGGATISLFTGDLTVIDGVARL